MEQTQTKKTDSAKYDRQLRLWGEEGQSYLEDAHVCLINATATGTETLKNLVLPGIGNFTIVDGNKVAASDFNNFFILQGTIGQSRAKVTKEALNELNDLVNGDYLEKDPVELINNSPDYFKKFTVVIANDLDEVSLLKLGKFCWDNKIVLIVTKVYGFLGYLRLVVPEHTVIESKPDNAADDLRLASPFPELEKYVDSIDITTLNSQEHSHVAFPVLLIQHIKKWKASHNGNLPLNYQEKSQFKSEIMKQMLNPTEENFNEAFKSAFKAFAPTKVPSSTEAILNDAKATNLTKDSSKFWILAAAVRDFVKNEGQGMLPLMGSIPDMTATTNGYLDLQRIYADKANSDVEAVHKRVQQTLTSLSLPSTHISLEEVKKFCKNSQFLQLYRFRSLDEERNPSTAKGSYIGSLLSGEPNANWYVVIRAFERFHGLHKRYPGDVDSNVAGDVTLLTQVVEGLMKEWNLTQTIDPKYVQEIVRYSNSELHPIASFFGGVASQEVIKLVTHQYMPLDNTFIYNGIESNSLVGSF